MELVEWELCIKAMHIKLRAHFKGQEISKEERKIDFSMSKGNYISMSSSRSNKSLSWS
jgi:hypothetical protein